MTECAVALESTKNYIRWYTLSNIDVLYSCFWQGCCHTKGRYYYFSKTFMKFAVNVLS